MDEGEQDAEVVAGGWMGACVRACGRQVVEGGLQASVAQGSHVKGRWTPALCVKTHIRTSNGTAISPCGTAVHADDPEFRDFNDISELPQHRLQEIRRCVLLHLWLHVWLHACVVERSRGSYNSLFGFNCIDSFDAAAGSLRTTRRTRTRRCGAGGRAGAGRSWLPLYCQRLAAGFRHCPFSHLGSSDANGATRLPTAQVVVNDFLGREEALRITKEAMVRGAAAGSAGHAGGTGSGAPCCPAGRSLPGCTQPCTCLPPQDSYIDLFVPKRARA